MKPVASVVIGALALVAGGAMAADDKAVDKRAAISSPDLSDSYKWSDLAGFEVKNQQDQELGSISELIVDKQGKISHVVLEEGGMLGGNSYVVPWDKLTLSPDEQAAVIDANPENLSSEFAAFDEEMPTAVEKKDTAKKDDSMKDDSMRREGGKPSSTY